MIICLGPVCVPLWHLGVIVAVLLQPLVNFARRAYLLLGGVSSQKVKVQTDEKKPAAVAHNRLVDDSQFCHSNSKPNQQSATRIVHKVKSSAKWHELINESHASSPIVVMFSASWCKPCKQITPTFEALAKQYEAVFLKVDTESLSDVSEKYDITALPSFVVFNCVQESGEDRSSSRKLCVIDKVVGAREGSLRDTLAEHCPQRESQANDEGITNSRINNNMTTTTT